MNTPSPMRIEYTDVDSLLLDPTNPRLGRRVASPKLAQDKVLEAMSEWTLDELATSFIESGFWPQEALIVVDEVIYGKKSLVVIEGNRRLAALKFLRKAERGEAVSKKWRDLAAQMTSNELLTQIPYIKVVSREAVSAYLGFRHVTGIKEWAPAEKAQYIAKLIEEEGLNYDEVRRKIGSKMPAVRQHYIAYKLLQQMDNSENIHMDAVEEKFSVLYLSLRSAGTQKYLGIDPQADPIKAKVPVDKDHLGKLDNYAGWLFGTDKRAPLFSDSRNVDEFGRILESQDSIDYLERAEYPQFDVARRKSSVGEEDVVGYVLAAADSAQLALAEAHLFRRSEPMAKAIERLSQDVMQLMSIFPFVKEKVLKEWVDDARDA